MEEKVAREGIKLTDTQIAALGRKPAMMKSAVKLKLLIRIIWAHRTRSTWAT